MLQTIFVSAIVTLALILMGRRAYRALAGKKPVCVCDETECPLHSDGTASSESASCPLGERVASECEKHSHT